MRQQRKRKSYTLVVIVIVLMLLSTSCRTAPEALPALEITIDWPDFPDPRGIVALSPDETIVVMPLDFWTSVAEYVLDVRAVRAILEATMGGPITIGGTE